MYHPRDGSFRNLFAQKYATLAQFHKPIIIAECGVSIKDDQTSWIAGMRRSVGGFQLLRTIIYFNAPDSYAWSIGQNRTGDYETPDFGLSAGSKWRK